MRPRSESPRGGDAAFPSLTEALARGPAFFSACNDLDPAKVLTFYEEFEAAHPADKSPSSSLPAGFRERADHRARVISELLARAAQPGDDTAPPNVVKVDNPYNIPFYDSESEGELLAEASDCELNAEQTSHGVSSPLAECARTPVRPVAPESARTLVQPIATWTAQTPVQPVRPESARKQTTGRARSILRRRPDDSPQIATVFPEIDSGDEGADGAGDTERQALGLLVYPYESDASPASRRASVDSRVSSFGENAMSAANETLNKASRRQSSASSAPLDAKQALVGDGVGSALACPDTEVQSRHDNMFHEDTVDDDYGTLDHFDDDEMEVNCASYGGRDVLTPINGNAFVQLRKVAASFAPNPGVKKINARMRQSGQTRPRRGPPKRLLKDLDVARAQKVIAEEEASGMKEPRRSSRQKFSPLEYWRNEHVVYERRKSRLMPTLAQVIEMDKSASDEALRQARKNRGSTGKAAYGDESKRGQK
jgi:hypothetical protein